MSLANSMAGSGRRGMVINRNHEAEPVLTRDDSEEAKSSFDQMFESKIKQRHEKRPKRTLTLQLRAKKATDDPSKDGVVPISEVEEETGEVIDMEIDDDQQSAESREEFMSQINL